MKPDYTEFDAALLDEIQNGRDTAMKLDIQNGRLHKLAEPFRVEQRWGKTPHWRITDRRLQALRKKGKITYTGKVWQIVQPA